MGGRYLITGVQLGLIKSLTKHDPAAVIEEIEKIENEQYAGESDLEVSLDAKEVRYHCMDS
jgi:hypothetical protein